MTISVALQLLVFKLSVFLGRLCEIGAAIRPFDHCGRRAPLIAPATLLDDTARALGGYTLRLC